MHNPRLNLGVLCSGRGTNVQAILDACASSNYPARVAIVVSDVEEAFGLERARRAGAPAVYLPRGPGGPGGPGGKGEPRARYDAKLISLLRERQVDLVCLAGFMRIVSPEFLQAFPRRVINIHPSLLPAFPGLHGQRAALEYGVKVSGCTVHFVDEGVDTGPLILQAAVPICDDDDEETLAARILVQEHELYPRAIQLIAEGRVRVEGRRVSSS